MNDVFFVLEVLGITFIVPILLIVGLLITLKKGTVISQVISLIGAVMLLTVAIISIRPEPTNLTSSSDAKLTNFLSREETKRGLQSWGLVIFSVGFAFTGIQQRKTK